MNIPWGFVLDGIIGGALFSLLFIFYNEYRKSAEKSRMKAATRNAIHKLLILYRYNIQK